MTLRFGDSEQDPQTLDEALDRVPMLADLAGIPRSEMRKLVCSIWPAWDRVKSATDPSNFTDDGPTRIELP